MTYNREPGYSSGACNEGVNSVTGAQGHTRSGDARECSNILFSNMRRPMLVRYVKLIAVWVRCHNRELGITLCTGFGCQIRRIFYSFAQKETVNTTFCLTNFVQEAPPVYRSRGYWKYKTHCFAKSYCSYSVSYMPEYVFSIARAGQENLCQEIVPSCAHVI